MLFFEKELDLLDSDSKKSLIHLVRDAEQRNLTLVCGAGLSVSAGLPSWYAYLQKIVSVFLVHWKFQEIENYIYKDSAPKQLSIALFDEYFEEELLDNNLPEQFLKEDSLILAQLVKNCIEPANWNYLLRKALYEDKMQIIATGSLFEEVSELLIQCSKTITGVLTYNYDDLLESTLLSKRFKTSSIINENHLMPQPNFPIFHMHGILPLKGGLNGKIYLSEEDYLTDIIQPNSWYNQLHGTKLTSTCCLFLGLSFNDPSVKRKLAIHRLNNKDFHYALLTHKDTEFDKKKFLLLKNELLRLNVRVIKYPYDSTGANSHSALNPLLAIIRKYISQIKTPLNA